MLKSESIVEQRAKAARAWWRAMQPYDSNGERNPSADRAALAKLRRADPRGALAEEATFKLFERLGYAAAEADHRLPRVATLAVILAHVREEPKQIKERPRTFAQMIGRETLGDDTSALLSELRFRRLLGARDEDDIAREFRRALAIADKKAPVKNLARLILRWDHDDVRRRFAFEYYAPGSSAPVESNEASS